MGHVAQMDAIAQAPRLQQQVQRFALMQGGPEAADISTILRLIDDTVLPRMIEVTGRADRTARLWVSNRRVLAANGNPAHVADDLADPTRAAQHFATALSWALQGGPGRVHISRIPPEGGVSDVGCDADGLALALECSGWRQQDAPLRDVMSYVRDIALAWVCADQGAGRAQDRALLQATLDATTPSPGARLDTAVQTVVIWPLAQGQDVMILPQDGQRMGALVPTAQRDAVLAMWRRAQATHQPGGIGPMSRGT